MFATEPASRSWNTRYGGKPALTAPSHGYRHGTIFGKWYLAHRVAWALHHGAWPSQHIDHISGDTGDNRIENLRDVTESVNRRNMSKFSTNTSGVCGVTWHKGCGKWQAQVGSHGRQLHLGLFENFDDAVAARKAAEVEYGFTDRHGT
jgi:hypothetical protein